MFQSLFQSLVANFQSRKRSAAETATIKLQNFQQIIATYKIALDDLNERFREYERREETYKRVIDELRQQISRLEARQNQMLHQVCIDFTCPHRKYPPIETCQ